MKKLRVRVRKQPSYLTMRPDCGYDSHLSNNSVAKYSDNFHTGAVGSENMWSVRLPVRPQSRNPNALLGKVDALFIRCALLLGLACLSSPTHKGRGGRTCVRYGFQVDDFKAFLASGEGGAGRWEQRIQPAMRHIVVATMKTVVD